MVIESLPYLSILVLCVAYIVTYSRVGITHPTVLFFLLVLFYLPFKYFLIKLGNFDYAYYPNEVGALSNTNAVERGGIVLMAYLFLSALLHQVFRLSRLSVPILSAEIRKSMVSFSVGLGLFLLVAFVALESVESLLDGLKFRAFTTQRGMAYISIIYELIVLVALSQALDSRKHLLFWALFAFHGSFSILAGRTGPIVNMIFFTLLYFIMVRRYVPIKILILSAVIVPVLALLHGIIRVRGDLSLGYDILMQTLMDSDEIFKSAATILIERIDQLEEFSVLSSAVTSGKLATDPLWPFQLFLQFVPRSLWIDKPFFFNAQMMSTFYPDILADNVTFNFLGIGEFIYAFNLLGIVPAALVTGFLLHVFDKYVKMSMGHCGAFLFFFLVPYYILNAGFHVGFMNTPIIPTVMVSFLVLFAIGKLKIIRYEKKAGTVGKMVY